MAIPVIELIRVSTEAQAADDRGGIPAQREINRRTASAYGLDIVKTFEIVDVSGAEILASPEMQELLRLIQSPAIQGILTKEFSRLMRPEKMTDYAILGVLVDTKTTLYLPDGPLNLTSSSGLFLGSIQAAVAGYERRQILDRMYQAKEAIRRAGRHPGGPASLPLGVAYSKEHGWSYTAEAGKVKQAFRLFLAGRSCADISNRLNIPPSTVRFILTNEIYKGVRVYTQKRDQSKAGYVPAKNGRQGYRRKIARPPEEIIRVPVMDGIISNAEFARVQHLMEAKRQNHWTHQSGSHHRYTYNGFLICGDCGSLLYTHSSRSQFYICKTRHTRQRRARELKGLAPCSNRYMLSRRVEPKIDALLSGCLQDRTFIARLVKQFKERQRLLFASAASQMDISTLKQKLKHLQSRKDRTLESFFEGVIDRGRRDTELARIHGEIAIYEDLLNSSDHSAGQWALTVENVLSILEPFQQWHLLNRDDKRFLLQRLCPEISVYKYVVKSLKLSIGNANRAGDWDAINQSKTDV